MAAPKASAEARRGLAPRQKVGAALVPRQKSVFVPVPASPGISLLWRTSPSAKWSWGYIPPNLSPSSSSGTVPRPLSSWQGSVLRAVLIESLRKFLLLAVLIAVLIVVLVVVVEKSVTRVKLRCEIVGKFKVVLNAPSLNRLSSLNRVVYPALNEPLKGYRVPGALTPARWLSIAVDVAELRSPMSCARSAWWSSLWRRTTYNYHVHGWLENRPLIRELMGVEAPPYILRHATINGLR
ncbi:predicted protein [Histoplasma capsulatum var. duboisii H88]|uniref:Predicted protein n=1 Tax=Ajellomyces capsulatus (strain H88) TaxID=544711 RepID=F0U4W3_AJEC8|nr:predicted protein [Histoplasma capsulatum var. duboisii H88]